MNVSRSPQGRPVFVQAGASERGRDFAARWAEVVFVTHSAPDPARQFRLDLRARAERFGRNPDQLRILPGVVPIIGETPEEAEDLRSLLESLSHPEAGLSTLSYHLGVDLSRLPQDQVLPDTMDVPGVEGHYREVAELTRRTGMSVAKLGQQYGAGRTARGFAGTAHDVADRMQEWWEVGACDGFMLQIPYFPGGWNAWCDFLCRNCNGVGYSERNTPGRHYGIILDWTARPLKDLAASNSRRCVR